MPSLPKTESDRDRRTETCALPIFFSGYYHALAFDEYCAGEGEMEGVRNGDARTREMQMFSKCHKVQFTIHMGIITPEFFFWRCERVHDDRCKDVLCGATS